MEEMKYEKYLNLFDKRFDFGKFYTDTKWSVEFCIKMFNLNVNQLNIIVDYKKHQIFLHENKLFIIISLDAADFEINICNVSNLTQLSFKNIFDMSIPAYEISFTINEEKFTISFVNEHLDYGYVFFADLVKEMKN